MGIWWAWLTRSLRPEQIPPPDILHERENTFIHIDSIMKNSSWAFNALRILFRRSFTVNPSWHAWIQGCGLLFGDIRSRVRQKTTGKRNRLLRVASISLNTKSSVTFSDTTRENRWQLLSCRKRSRTWTCLADESSVPRYIKDSSVVYLQLAFAELFSTINRSSFANCDLTSRAFKRKSSREIPLRARLNDSTL